jgi:outer membrane immunogenic protein
MLRSFLLGSVGAIALASTAFAADMYKAPEGAGSFKDGPVIATWNGLYVGVNAGYAWNNNDVKLEGLGGTGWIPYHPDPLRTWSTDGNGFTGGAQIGYNRQFDTLVLGVEADISKINADADLKANGSFNGDAYSLRLRENLDWLSTVRGRVGVTPTSGTLLYVTGGLAVGKVSSTSNLDWPLTHYDASESSTKAGWTAGGGVEYALTPNWSLKAEYLYYDLGKVSVTANSAPKNLDYQTGTDFDVTGNIVRAGLNYRFGPDHESLK